MSESVALLAILTGVVFAVGLWWFGTGAILWLDRQPRVTYGWSLLCGLIVAGVSVAGLVVSRDDATVLGALTAFAAAVGLWGWHELLFLTGFVTGPRRTPCPTDARGGRRFWLAAETLIYHELALAVTVVLLALLDRGAANSVGLAAFLVLFVGRLSAKLNLFLGAPYFTSALFPDHLRYLASYVRTGHTSLLFPVSIALGAAFSGAEAWRALRPGVFPFEAASAALLFALAALAILEHLFMLAPFADAALWRWAAPGLARSPAEAPLSPDPSL